MLLTERGSCFGYNQLVVDFTAIPILQGLEITSRTAGNRVIQEAIDETAKSIAQGDTIASPLRESGVFPPMVVQMISVGESAGALDTMLCKIADFYDDEVDAAKADEEGLLRAPVEDQRGHHPPHVVHRGDGGVVDKHAALLRPLAEIQGAGQGPVGNDEVTVTVAAPVDDGALVLRHG